MTGFGNAAGGRIDQIALPGYGRSMNKRVLLAEDEANIIESLAFLLERAGYVVDVHTNGTNACQAVLAAKPDLLILDVMLPGMDGYEILRNIRANESTATLPVLMLTAKGQREDRDMALRNGADRFISKPFSNAEIIAAVNELAERADTA